MTNQTTASAAPRQFSLLALMFASNLLEALRDKDQERIDQQGKLLEEQLARLEVKPEHAPYVEQARNEYATDDLEIDDHPIVTENVDGLWINAWVHVPTAKSEEENEDVTSDGSEQTSEPAALLDSTRRTYQVTLHRTAASAYVHEVEASSEQEAREIALAEAGNIDFNEGTERYAEYEAKEVSELPAD